MDQADSNKQILAADSFLANQVRMIELFDSLIIIDEHRNQLEIERQRKDMIDFYRVNIDSVE